MADGAGRKRERCDARGIKAREARGDKATQRVADEVASINREAVEQRRKPLRVIARRRPICGKRRRRWIARRVPRNDAPLLGELRDLRAPRSRGGADAMQQHDGGARAFVDIRGLAVRRRDKPKRMQYVRHCASALLGDELAVARWRARLLLTPRNAIYPPAMAHSANTSGPGVKSRGFQFSVSTSSSA